MHAFLTRHPDYYPSGMTAFAIVSTLVCATWTDATRSRARWPVLVYMSIAVIVSSICILVWSSPTGLKFFAYCECRRIPLPVYLGSLILVQIWPEQATPGRPRRSRGRTRYAPTTTKSAASSSRP